MVSDSWLPVDSGEEIATNEEQTFVFGRRCLPGARRVNFPCIRDFEAKLQATPQGAVVKHLLRGGAHGVPGAAAAPLPSANPDDTVLLRFKIVDVVDPNAGDL